ncbi:unnamed protein product [Durusdinium trenchii]|uniref:Fe2OG dioxygenase domain-containing protein n=1 Tax=Durusdinium trenchii TaxID=1381693 RepID=A0ABP0LQL0_9DINO
MVGLRQASTCSLDALQPAHADMKVPEISLKSFYKAEADSNLEDLWSKSCVRELAEELRNACEEVGFFVLTDHGICDALMESLRKECTAFFKRPPQSNVLGMVSSTDSRFLWLDHVPCDDGPAWSLGPVHGRGSMPWQLDQEEFATVWTAYYAEVEKLVARLMSLFAVAMHLPATTFDSALKNHRSSMRAILYPELAEADFEQTSEVIRSPEHTDWGCVTVLLADPEVSGLEICDKDGGWTSIQPQRHALVVNLGELLQWWTGGKWLATPHRVLARPDSAGERLSCPYFGLVNRETLLQPLLAESGNHEGITAGEFLQNHERYRALVLRSAKDSRARY